MFPSEDDLEISVTEVSGLLDGPEKERAAFKLVDCREEDEFALCRIEPATLVPLSAFAERAETALPDKEEAVVVYCHHGMRSQQAALYLRNRGHSRAWSMRGGIDAWSVEVDPAVPRY